MWAALPTPRPPVPGQLVSMETACGVTSAIQGLAQLYQGAQEGVISKAQGPLWGAWSQEGVL